MEKIASDPRVAVVANVVIDEYFIGLKSWPTTSGVRFTYKEKVYGIGGNAPTVAIGLAAMSKVNVAVFAGIGHGGHGEAVLSAFGNKPKTKGVPSLIGAISCQNSNPKGSRISTGTTAIRLADGGEPEFVTCAGANATVNCAFLMRHIDSIATCCHLHLGGLGVVLSEVDYFELETFLIQVRKRNPAIIISLDVVLPSEADSFGKNLNLQLFRVLGQVDYFLPNCEEAYLFAGIERCPQSDDGLLAEAARKLNLAGIRQATVIKRGRLGVSVFPRHLEPFDVRPDRCVASEDVVDSVGAGDTWDAGFIAAGLMGYGLRDRCRVGNRVAATCIQALGATAGIKPFGLYSRGIAPKESAA